MPRALAALALLLCPLSAPAPAAEPTGHLVLIGGGERSGYLMQRIVELAGGARARFLVVPLAHPEPAAAATALVEELELAGAGGAEILRLDPDSAGDWESLQRIALASGLFLAGGDAGRLAAALRDPDLLDRVRELYWRGGVIAGTSAGATVLGASMILGPADARQDPDRAIPDVRAGSLRVEPGLALLPETIVDQHFLARRRQNRLLAALLEAPGLLGIGIDEATAIVVGPPDRFEVLGEGLVAVYDAGAVESVAADARGNLSASGIVLHLLGSGQRFDLATRRPLP